MPLEIRSKHLFQTANSDPKIQGAGIRVTVKLDGKDYAVELAGGAKTSDAEIRTRALEKLASAGNPAAAREIERLGSRPSVAKGPAVARGFGVFGFVGLIVDAIDASHAAKDPQAVADYVRKIERGQMDIGMIPPNPSLIRQVRQGLDEARRVRERRLLGIEDA